MRCPKCHYISFENGERCRNCGYDFSLTVDVKSLDLPIQTGDEPTGPLADLKLSGLDTAVARAAVPSQLASVHGSSHSEADGEAAQRQYSVTGFDLPLFSTGDPHDDRPLVGPPAVPRAPLAVRRAGPAIARPRPRDVSDMDAPALALEAPDDEPHVQPRPHRPARVIQKPVAADLPAAPSYVTASLVRRSFGGIIDALIILGIDAGILYFTLRLCGLRLNEAMLLPPVPFLTFVLLLNGGYLSAFVAAGGQTIGKMAAGTRVIRDLTEAGGRVSFGYAVVRAAAYLVSILPVGLGLLPAVFSAERRALHDRLADTRVVRV